MLVFLRLRTGPKLGTVGVYFVEAPDEIGVGFVGRSERCAAFCCV